MLVLIALLIMINLLMQNYTINLCHSWYLAFEFHQEVGHVLIVVGIQLRELVRIALDGSVNGISIMCIWSIETTLSYILSVKSVG